MQRLSFLFALLFLCFSIQLDAQVIHIPTAGNTWINGGNLRFDRDGEIRNWESSQTKFTTYFRTNRTGSLHLFLHTKTDAPTAKINIKLANTNRIITITNTDWQQIDAGEFQIKDTGYQTVEYTAISKTGRIYASIDSVEISGAATLGETNFTPNNDGNFYYWGRRGPSVHLNYGIPKNEKIEWFYNEVTIPKDKDPVGSYFMANGFSVGYFGFQVNGQDLRKILFSVWSPFTTDNPAEIPESDRIQLVKNGENVHIGKFGGEGSGGQSYLEYPWQSGNTYKFLLRAHPNSDSTTEFTAYFQDANQGTWLLIASFNRPKTSTWLTGLHSFTENFDPKQGNLEREATYNNQWICTADGKWSEVRKAQFSGDNTAWKGYRKDYAGGIEGNSFYLKNGGFFSQFIPLGGHYERKDTKQKAPNINFATLP